MSGFFSGTVELTNIFVNLTTDQTISGIKSFSNILKNFYGGIGAFQTGSSFRAYQDISLTGNYFDIWTSADSLKFSYNATSYTSVVATISNTGVYSVISDKRLKENVECIPYGINEIMQLNPTKYNFIKNPEIRLGFIAQDIKKIIPEIINLVNNNDDENDKDEKNGYYFFSMVELIPVIVKAIQEQQVEINKQQVEINNQQIEINNLIQRIGNLESK